MKTFDKQCAQGDMLITRVDSIPKEFRSNKQEPSERPDDHIIAHSETGHHHVVAAEKVNFFAAANDPFVSYLEVKEPTEIRHLREFDTHEPILLQPGMFRINRQREWTQEEPRMVMD